MIFIIFFFIIYKMNINIDWTPDIENILESIRLNCIILSNYHKEKYYYYKSLLKYFKLPLICLSSLTSIFSVGLQGYIKQSDISILTCLLSFFSAIIASIELYLGIQKNMEIEMLASRNLLILGYDIYKTLNLNAEHRKVNGKVYLEEKFNEYIKLVEQANLIHTKKLIDSLAPINKSILNNLEIKTISSSTQLSNQNEDSDIVNNLNNI